MEQISTVGRRKTSVARIFMKKGTGAISINEKDLKSYFPTLILQHAAVNPLTVLNLAGDFDIQINVDGGGVTGQAGAVSLGIARALVEYNPENKKALKALGLMTRDPRMVERKKPGQKKARKRFQFSKR